MMTNEADTWYGSTRFWNENIVLAVTVTVMDKNVCQNGKGMDRGKNKNITIRNENDESYNEQITIVEHSVHVFYSFWPSSVFQRLNGKQIITIDCVKTNSCSCNVLCLGFSSFLQKLLFSDTLSTELERRREKKRNAPNPCEFHYFPSFVLT